MEIKSEKKTKRKTELDVVRIIAFLMIFTYHFTVALGMQGSIFQGYRNGGWGSVGSTIFFVLSGYLLMAVDAKKLVNGQAVGTFYKKRFSSIIPLQSAVFLVFYVLHSIRVHSFLYGGSLWKIVLSLVGVDGYAHMYGMQNYYLVGEWFTAVILMIYLLFPLMVFVFQKAAVLGTIVICALYFLNMAFQFQSIVADASIFTGALLFWAGMIFAYWDTGKTATLKPAVKALIWLALFIVAVVIIFVPLPTFCGYTLPWKNLLGIILFVLMKTAFGLIPYHAWTTKTFAFLSRIGFAFYLCHHVILSRYVELFPQMVATRGGRILSWVLLVVFIGLIAWIFDTIVSKLKRLFSSQRTKLR